jgi:hypothetical protein
MSISSKLTKDLNVRPEILKLVQERAGNTMELVGIGIDFVNRIQKAQKLKEMIDK